MNLKEIRESGLLELYVLGQLNSDETQQVLEALNNYPELKQDLIEIETALKNYADLHSVVPQTDVKSKIMEEVKSSGNTSSSKNTKSSTGINLSSLIWMSLVTLLAISYYLKQNNFKDLERKYNRQVVACDSLTEAHNQRLEMLDQIQNPGTQIIPIAATEKYPETNIYFFNNEDLEKNIIQIQNLPELAENESFQLWSLKDGSDPIPLDVFEDDQNYMLEVAFVENSNAYAITIEPRGGSQQPNLEQLIGVFSI